jgi:hypothetical protein
VWSSFKGSQPTSQPASQPAHALTHQSTNKAQVGVEKEIRVSLTTHSNNKKVILASLVPTHPGSASPFRTVVRLLLRAMGVRCSVSCLTRSPNGLTTLDTNLPAQCAMATPSLDRAVPRQGRIRPLTYVRQVQPAIEPARVTEQRYSFPLLSLAENQAFLGEGFYLFSSANHCARLKPLGTVVGCFS